MSQRHLPDQPAIDEYIPRKGKRHSPNLGRRKAVTPPIHPVHDLIDPLLKFPQKPSVHPIETDVLPVSRRDGFLPQIAKALIALDILLLQPVLLLSCQCMQPGGDYRLQQKQRQQEQTVSSHDRPVDQQPGKLDDHIEKSRGKSLKPLFIAGIYVPHRRLPFLLSLRALQTLAVHIQCLPVQLGERTTEQKERFRPQFPKMALQKSDHLQQYDIPRHQRQYLSRPPAAHQTGRHRAGQRRLQKREQHA